uniref:SH3 domain containing 19 n=1 Tax=Neogobius melanostomus TaxID=47308 RepID=A0A8C6UZH9_9GOBI
MSLRARIKAFENQADEAAQPVKPQPKSRTKPPVAAKPSGVKTPQFSVDNFYEEVCYSPPTPAPRPAQKPEGAAGNSSVTEELKAILAQHRSKPPKLTRDNSVHDEEFVKAAPTLPAKPNAKEPLEPNLNINNHNNYAAQPVYEDADENGPMGGEESTYSEYEYSDNLGLSTSEAPHDPMENEYDIPDNTYEDDTSQESENAQSEYDVVEYAPSTSKKPEHDHVDKTYQDKTSNNFPVKPEPTKSNYAGSRQSLTKRPTTIIVPAKGLLFQMVFRTAPLPCLSRSPWERSTHLSRATGIQSPLSHLRRLPVLRQNHRSHHGGSQPKKNSHPGVSRWARAQARADLPLRMWKPPVTPTPRLGTLHLNPSHQRPKTKPCAAPQTQPRTPALQQIHCKRHSTFIFLNFFYSIAPFCKIISVFQLQVPHAVASSDYSGSSTGELSFQKNEVLELVNAIDPNTFECQVGDRRGRVHRSNMKVITPFSAATQATPLQAGKPTGSGSGLTVEVLHDFSPENPGELGLKAGDVVTMVEQVDDEWYGGTCRGSSGFFPINYVKVLTISPRLPDRTGTTPSVNVSGPRCVAKFDFESEQSDELSFSEGDVIQLKAYVGQDWARGQLGAFSGIFPLNFVEIIQDLPPAPSQKQQQTPLRKIALPGMSKSARTKVAPPAQSGAEWVVALYDFSGNSEQDLSFEKGDRILITKHIDQEWSSGRLDGREGIFPRTFVQSKTAGQTSHQNGGAGGVRAKALYDFTSTCEEELSIKVGDIVTNVESVDNEWFLGDLRGKRALVPKNYVQVM